MFRFKARFQKCQGENGLLTINSSVWNSASHLEYQHAQAFWISSSPLTLQRNALTGVLNLNDLWKRNCSLTLCAVSHSSGNTFLPFPGETIYHVIIYQLISLTALGLFFPPPFFNYLCITSDFSNFLTDINTFNFIKYWCSLFKILCFNNCEMKWGTTIRINGYSLMNII